MSAHLRRAALREAALAWERDGRRARSLWRAWQLDAFADVGATEALPAEFIARSHARARLRQRLARTSLALLAGAALLALVALRRDASSMTRRSLAAWCEGVALIHRWHAAEAELLVLRARELDARGLPHQGLVMALAAHAAARESGGALALAEREVMARRAQRPWRPEHDEAIDARDETGHPHLRFVQSRGMLAVEDVRTGQQSAALLADRWSLPAGGVSPDARLAVACTEDLFPGEPTLTLWDLSTGRRRWRVPAPCSEPAVAFSWSVDGRHLLETTRDLDGLAVPIVWRVWDLASGRLLRTLESRNVAPLRSDRSAYVRPRASLLFLRSGAGPLPSRWTYARGSLAAALLRAPDADRVATAVSPDARVVAMADGASPVTLWDAASGHLLRALATRAPSVYSLGDGGRLVTHPEGAVWEVSSGFRLQALGSEDRPINPSFPPALSADGRCLAAWGNDASATTWSTLDGSMTGRIDHRLHDASGGLIESRFAGTMAFALGSCDLLVGQGSSWPERWSTPASLAPTPVRDAAAVAAWVLRRTSLRVCRDDHQIVDWWVDQDADAPSPWAPDAACDARRATPVTAPR